jgi:phosphoribosylanthranilate isomerase
MFVKICGITNEEDALLAVAMGADAVGFIFAPSKRQVSVTRARDIAKRLPPEILTVGVFRDEAPQRVVEIIQTAGLRAAQLDGHETPEISTWIRKRLAFTIQGFAAGDPNIARADEYSADAILIGSSAPGQGKMFDWSLAEGAPAGRKVIMCGGLTPENVGDAIARVGPWGVDVATGVERDDGEPGQKDPRKVHTFIANARAAAPRGYTSTSTSGPYDWLEDE